jgi:hypothetical protein
MELVNIWGRVCAASAAVVLLLTACGGGGGGSSLPQGGVAPAMPSIAGRHTLSNAAIQRGVSRITQMIQGSGAADAMRAMLGKTSPAYPVTADPPVERPDETPCTVTLFTNFQFTNFTYPTFQYTPPASCPPPWAKVVFSGNFSVTAGIQFDRTGSVWIDGTNVYFGTTSEPSPNASPSWHVERDVTYLSPIFETPSTGEVVLGNIVNSTYTGVISGSGALQFYPASQRYPAAHVADDVYPLSGGPLGDNQYIDTQAQPLTGTFTLPRNVQAAYLDVYLQSQHDDEFWYSCFPDNLAAEIPNCPNTAFREGEVAIDGQPAGIVPVYPWIFTGGIDPFLWIPIPGVETLEFKPYRVNLTPFAGILSNGSPHTITVNVLNNGNYFAANGTLLVYLDHGSAQVTGGIITDTDELYPNPNVTENVTFNSNGVGSGPVTVTSRHPLFISGYVDTSHGRVVTQVRQVVTFSNAQQVTGNATGTLFDQSIKQLTTVNSTVTTFGGGEQRTATEQFSWPLQLVYDFAVNANGSATQTASVSQGKFEQIDSSGVRGVHLSSNTVTSSDTLNFLTNGTVVPSNGTSSQTYRAYDSHGYCYSKTVTSRNYVITGESGGFCGSGGQ